MSQRVAIWRRLEHSQHVALTSEDYRDPGIVLVLCVFTCGLYLLYWYAKVYEEVERLAGETPTGHAYMLDLLLVVVTCGLYGVWVDYRISQQLHEIQTRLGYPRPSDTGMLVVGLDISAYITGFFTNFVSSAIHQDLLNKIARLPAPIAPSLPESGPSSVT